MIEIVNVVASGSIDKKINLEILSRECCEIAEYDPEHYPGVYLRFSESDPLVTLYRTGKYIISGGSCISEVESLREKFLKFMVENSVIESADDQWFEIQNVVCTTDLGYELELNEVAIGLGIEHTEYSTEQFPGLTYRPPEHDSIALIFTSGKIVITGSKDLATAEQTGTLVENKLKNLLQVTD